MFKYTARMFCWHTSVKMQRITSLLKLWAQYSIVKSCLIIYDNIDISKFPKLITFLKETGDGYQAKKSKILTKNEIDRFLSSTDDKGIFVGLILGIAGACRTDELINLTVDDIEDVGPSLIVKIPNTKTKIPRIFVVTDVGNMLELFRKYLSIRPPHVKHKRLFLYYKAGKCSSTSWQEYHGKNS
ncbi:hypothetical protein NQ317_016980 [Molorchus minor]|uniref:Tyr recombinase domain-containing protein n=1 Tax=Molorchus minor TaxID=1323400 RepID=A0ABQ9JCF3_9CUCU|nr:hypothetical protein NQ317_016980 [Molorchus minor]